MMNEFQLIEKIKSWIPRSLQGPLGIGHDAALLKSPASGNLVFSTDVLVEGVDFSRNARQKGFLPPLLVGRKALAVNLSDLAAMGAKPLACVVSLGLPEKIQIAWLRDFYSGLVNLAKQTSTFIVGGDLTRSKEFFVSIAILGSSVVKRKVSRSGARLGDWIAVSGVLGGSILGRHARFQPRLAEAQFLVSRFRPTSLMDISDGFLQDLGHILKASRKGAELEMLQIPISQAAVKLAQGNPLKAFQRACTDGEDFELLFTIPPQDKEALAKAWLQEFPRTPLSWVGRVTTRSEKIDWLSGGQPVSLKFEYSGYQHFV